MNEDDPNQEDDEKDLVTTLYYDTRGNLIGTTDAEGNKISHEYDGFNRKILTIRYLKNGEKIETSFTYYDNNLPKTITDDKGNITEYKFDDQKRLTRVIYPDESYIEVTHTYTTKDDIKYKRVIIKQRNETVVTNDYDKLGRLVNRTIQKGEDVEGTTFENFDYDGLNRLTYAENDNFVVEFKFDPLNRITEEKQRGKLLNYTYSVVNNLRRMTMKYPNDRLIEKNFDLLDRLSNIKQGDNEIANFKYIGRSYRLLSKQFGNGDAVSYLYDQGRRMTEKKAVNKNNDLINHYKHGYNKVHMKIYEQRMHENGIGDVFGYDAVYRLTNAKFNVPDPTVSNPTDFERERSILLDHLDNITRIDETKNGETTQITTEIPLDTDFLKLNQYSRFDQWGLAYDKNGNLTQKSTQKMYHDYRNQMVRVTEGTTTTENKYDALGRRLQKIITAGSQSKTENYYYSGHQVIEVRDGSDQVKRQFIYGNGIDEVIRMDAYSGSAITSYYFHSNAIGSTTAVTDANGQVVERYKYGLYGMPTFMDAAGNVIPKSTIGNNILFQGREYEPETNFYYFRARHYDPIMGRFLQVDPMGYEDSLNLYQAFGMNPINFTDPFGSIIKKEDLYELRRINKSQGTDAAKRWIDRNPNFSSGEKLDLHMKVIFGFEDPDAELKNISYIPVWTEFWAFIDETAYQMSKTYLKFHAGVKHRRFDIAAEALGEIAVYGGTGGFLGHYIPEGVTALCEKFPILNKNISSLVKEGAKDVRHAVQSPGAAQSVIDEINPKYFNPDTRFGRAFYVAEEGGTAVAEVTSHGGNVSNVIRFKINLRNQKVLDLTKSSIATKWGYNPNLAYRQTQKIAEKALKEGFKIIAFPSTQGSGTNYAILSNFEKILKALMVTPVGK